MEMLGARIAALRRSAGWSQAELGNRLGVSPSAIGMYEQGRREPAGALLIAMAEVFSVSTDYLLTGKTGNEQEAATVDHTLLQTLDHADLRLSKRDKRPFSRQELLVLMTALLLDT
jgi:transcriptional regulator with XRE-family HTH domain